MINHSASKYLNSKYLNNGKTFNYVVNKRIVTRYLKESTIEFKEVYYRIVRNF